MLSTRLELLQKFEWLAKKMNPLPIVLNLSFVRFVLKHLKLEIYSYWFYFALFFLVIISYGRTTLAGHCDINLLIDSQNPLSYQERKGRCEGLFIEKVSGTSLNPISFTSLFNEFDPSKVETLTVSWPTYNSSPMKLRAKATRWRLHYRMDATLPNVQTHFLWPTNILSALDITKEDIGVVGWVEKQFGGKIKTVYLPLTITSRQNQSTPNGNYRLVVVPNEPINEIYISIASADNTGTPQTFFVDSEPLSYGYYPAHRALTIPLVGFMDSGVYYVEISAVLRNGGSTIYSFLTYHEAEQNKLSHHTNTLKIPAKK